MKKVSIIIVNWNGGEVFKECVESLKKLEYDNFEIIVVDNGSTDDSLEFVKFIKNVKVIRNNKNLGFAPANNQGYKKSSGEYILLLNNDTIVKPNLLKVMVKKMEEDGGVGAMQPKIFIMDKNGYLDNAGSFMTNTGFLVHWGYLRKDGSEFDREAEIFSAKGACLMTRREVIDKIGLFDSDFVSYFEETDFCWRVWLAGYKVLFYPQTSIRHKVGFTSKRFNVFDINYNSMKNRLCSLIKNLNTWNLIFIFGRHMVIVLGLMFYYLLKLQFKKAKMIFDAIWWNVHNLGNTLQKRRRVQKLRKISDDDIFQKVARKFDIGEMLIHFGKVEENFKL